MDVGGIAAASDLLSVSFFASYRYYGDSNTTARTPGLNIELVGTNASNYVLAFVQSPYTPDAWNTASVATPPASSPSTAPERPAAP